MTVAVKIVEEEVSNFVYINIDIETMVLCVIMIQILFENDKAYLVINKTHEVKFSLININSATFKICLNEFIIYISIIHIFGNK